jgi:hypothetical protein
MADMNNFENTAILRCKEKDLKDNIIVLCKNMVNGIPNIPTIIGKGRYFYFVLEDKREVEKLPLKGKIL